MVSGGGTAGHVYPVLSVAEALLEGGYLRPEDIWYVGSPGGMEVELAKRAGLAVALAQAGPVRGQGPWTAALNGLRTLAGAWHVRQLVAQLRPEVVLLTGGYVSVPVALGARLQNVPILIYLPDLEPGLAVRVLARLARRIAVTAEPALRFFPAGKAMVTGYPVRRALLTATRAEARQRLGLEADRLTLLITGGSRGARSINRAVISAAASALQTWQIVHITGPLDYDEVQAARAALPGPLQGRYHVHQYLHEEMPDALAAADLVLARAGASVLGELPAAGVAGVLVPYPHAGRHQEANSAYLAERGAAVQVDDDELADRLPGVLHDLAGDPAQLRRMGQQARALARPEAAQALADHLVALAARNRWEQ